MSSALAWQSWTRLCHAGARNRSAAASGSRNSCGHLKEFSWVGRLWRCLGILVLREFDVGNVLLGLVAQLEVTDYLLHKPRFLFHNRREPLLEMRRSARVIYRLQL